MKKQKQIKKSKKGWGRSYGYETKIKDEIDESKIVKGQMKSVLKLVKMAKETQKQEDKKRVMGMIENCTIKVNYGIGEDDFVVDKDKLKDEVEKI